MLAKYKKDRRPTSAIGVCVARVVVRHGGSMTHESTHAAGHVVAAQGAAMRELGARVRRHEAKH